MSELREHEEEFKRQVLALEPFVGEGAVVLSPATRNVFLRLEALLDILVDHEERRYRQAMEVLGPQARGG